MPVSDDGHFSFVMLDGGQGLALVTVSGGGQDAGSVMVQSCGEDIIAIGRLYIVPQWRGRGAARALMLHVLGLWPDAEAWLLAEPYTRGKDEPGPGRAVLEEFYRSLGFAAAVDAAGRPAMRRVP